MSGTTKCGADADADVADDADLDGEVTALLARRRVAAAAANRAAARLTVAAPAATAAAAQGVWRILTRGRFSSH